MGRIVRIVGGLGLILIGIALLVLPGPGLLTIFAGITVVASEFVWAAKIVAWAKEKTARFRKQEAERPSELVDEDDQTG